ncbi:MAG: 30S ribosomal protein S12 methylthiotransferase RimO [Planctomycetota bacterium]
MPRSKPRSRAKIGMVSLGCPKNLVDTEMLLGTVAQEHVICGDPRDADIVIVNTCAFIDQSRAESLQAIREVAGWKEQGKIRGLVVAGCMAQRYGDQIREAVPTVDSILAMAEYGRVGEVVRKILDAKGQAEEAQAPWRTLVAPDGRVPVIREETGRLRVTPRHYAYLRVSEGCSNACTFCSIPTFRGLFKSKPPEMILAEAKELVGSGAQELNLISQDTTDYGRDLTGKAQKGGLAWLLEQLAKIDGVRWLRILYAYPGHVSDELIDTMARLQAGPDRAGVLPYLDMPIQHINSRMLKRMGRRHTREETRELLEKLRARVPGIVLRTSLISGFPGETDKEHDELVSFVKEFAFERLGVFPYSHEKTTPAGEKFEDDIHADLKQARVDELMKAQQPIAFAHNKRLVGKSLEVVVEGTNDEGVPVGRSIYDAPEIDPVVYLEGDVTVGEFVTAKVLKGIGYDLIAEVADAGGKTKSRGKAKAASAPKKARRLPMAKG